MAFILAKASGAEIFPPVVPCPSLDQGLLCWSSPLRAPMSCDSHLGPIQTLTAHSACSNMSHHLGSHGSLFQLSCSQCRFPSTPISLKVQAQYFIYGSRQRPIHCLPHPQQRPGFLSSSLLNAELLDACLANRSCILGEHMIIFQMVKEKVRGQPTFKEPNKFLQRCPNTNKHESNQP